jgi:hypothetical protein
MTVDPTIMNASAGVVCPHLDLVGPDAAGELPRAVPDPANRCLALTDPLHLSPDQQRLVCATNRHRTCRRYTLAATGAAPTAFGAVRPLYLRPAVVASLVLVAVAFVVAVAYLVNGGSLLVALV